MLAKYKYRTIENNEVVCYSCLVKIVENNKRTYLVELLNFCRGYDPGQRIRVNKKSIEF